MKDINRKSKIKLKQQIFNVNSHKYYEQVWYSFIDLYLTGLYFLHNLL